MEYSFTESQYEEILEAALKRFYFVSFLEDFDPEFCAIWRHDVDFSPQRALAMAKIESSFGIKSTFFIQLASRFYNPFEPEIKRILIDIINLGHDVGLHFDPESYQLESMQGIEIAVKNESSVLAGLINREVNVFSLHNPTVTPGLQSLPRKVANLVNASSDFLYKHFSYCSDSNGIWKYRDLLSVIKDEHIKRLYALTHPEWWQRTEMSPRKKIQRCIDGRAKKSAAYYDGLLKEHMRPNLGAD